MAEINKPALSVAWAESGLKTEPTDTKKNTGWVVEKPPYEWWNFIEHRQDKMLQHINQHGIAVWDSATGYIANKSYVLGSNGDIYRAVADSVGVNPVGDTSNKWFRVLDNYYLKGEVDSFIAAAIIPSGAIIDFAMDTVPSGYLVCNGAAVSRAAFPTLFSRIGVLYGSGDGSTTFNLPDFRNEFRRGASSARPVGTKEKGTLVGGYDDVGTENIAPVPNAGTVDYSKDPVVASDYGITSVVIGSVPYAATLSAASAASFYGVTRPRNISVLTCIKV